MQLPQPNSKPLKYESAEDVKDTVDAFLRTDSSETSGKYKLSQASLKECTEPRLNKVQNANDVFSWDMYKKPVGYVAPQPKSSNFLSRLDDTVKSIDFNNMTASQFEDNSPQITIHKRARGSPDDIKQSTASTSAFINNFANPQRKKYKVIPNKAIASNIPTNQSPEEPTEKTELPHDRKELLRFVSYIQISNGFISQYNFCYNFPSCRSKTQ